MNSYKFHQLCLPRNDFRLKEIVEWLDLMRVAFEIECFYNSKSKPIELSENNLQIIFEKNRDKRFPKIGSTDHFFSRPPKLRHDETVRFEIHTGTHCGEKFVDTFDVSIGNRPAVPHFKHLKQSIEIFHPFEAYLSESKNESDMNAYDRFQAAGFNKPAIIRGFHYLDETFARSIGGTEYCLKSPVWKVEQFCHGVLIQLIEGVFDTRNPSHLEAQRLAMKYFKM